MILPALTRGGYRVTRQALTGERLGGGRHRVDVLVETKAGEQILVSVKWQQVSGTAEQKVPFEIMCLADTIRRSRGRFRKAYLVLGGEGWTLREYFLHGNIREYLRNCEQVEIITLEGFVGKANQGNL
jgi:hypothetical protein